MGQIRPAFERLMAKAEKFGALKEAANDYIYYLSSDQCKEHLLLSAVEMDQLMAIRDRAA